MTEQNVGFSSRSRWNNNQRLQTSAIPVSRADQRVLRMLHQLSSRWRRTRVVTLVQSSPRSLRASDVSRFDSRDAPIVAQRTRFWATLRSRSCRLPPTHCSRFLQLCSAQVQARINSDAIDPSVRNDASPSASISAPCASVFSVLAAEGKKRGPSSQRHTPLQ